MKKNKGVGSWHGLPTDVTKGGGGRGLCRCQLQKPSLCSLSLKYLCVCMQGHLKLPKSSFPMWEEPEICALSWALAVQSWGGRRERVCEIISFREQQQDWRNNNTIWLACWCIRKEMAPSHPIFVLIQYVCLHLHMTACQLKYPIMATSPWANNSTEPVNSIHPKETEFLPAQLLHINCPRLNNGATGNSERLMNVSSLEASVCD